MSHAEDESPANFDVKLKELKRAMGQENVESSSIKTQTDDHYTNRLQTPATRANLEPSASVKFILMPMNQVVTLACSLSIPLNELRAQFSKDLKMAAEHINFFDSKNQLIPNDGSICLGDLGVAPNGIIDLYVKSVNEQQYPLKAYEPKENYSSGDFITVHVNMGDNQIRELVVEIERSNIKKPFLGGFKNKLTGKEYLNASSQTPRPIRPDNGIEKFCRDTQTLVSNHLKLQTLQDMSTQMTKPGVFVSRVQDKLLTPRPYQTAEERHEILVKNVIIIQKYFRSWQAKNRFFQLKAAYEARIAWEKQKELDRIKFIEQRRQDDINRRLNPRSKDDFEIIYAALEKWRLEEMAKLNASKTGAARKAALAMLVDQEAELIATIERFKIEASKENREKNIQYLLEKMSKPKMWKYKDGSTTLLDTPYSIRGRELKEIFNSLNMNYLTQDERLDVLLTLKHTVKEHDCKLTQDIINLIDREADLLMRGIKDENLQGLRKRISSLFLQYIKTPQFNPAIARHLRVPQDISEKVESFYCNTCERYLPTTEFQVSATSSKVGKCRNCKSLENTAIKRIDFTKFKFLLHRIQQEEQIYGIDSRICFLMTERDIQYLFDSIWSGQSILSASSDIYKLHFVRWDKNEEWSPWNTILLTLDETDSHMKLKDLEANYGEQFVKKVKQKHVLARNHFAKLPLISEYLKNSEAKGGIHLPRLTGIKIN